jgi:hypothetical protein
MPDDYQLSLILQHIKNKLKELTLMIQTLENVMVGEEYVPTIEDNECED